MGAMGKSAQFLLHTWLPDAMEGPTPVSALIHAATMVTAGVFMVARLSPLFELAPDALTFVTFIGATTAFFAATVGLVQNDIKRIVAYSTCSQLGYMFVAMGVGAYSVGMFHLFTHAFFKALLFLGSGSVIHRDASRAGHPQDGRPEGRDPVHLLDDGDRHAGADRLSAHRRLFLQGRDHRGGLSSARTRWRSMPSCCTVGRGAADLVLFLAADLHDLPRRAARPASLRGGARKPAGDAGAARRAGGRLARRRLAVQGIFAGHEVAGVLPRRRSSSPKATTSSRTMHHVPLLDRRAADGDDGDRLRRRLAVLHPPPGHAGRARAPARRCSTASCSTSGTSTSSTTSSSCARRCGSAASCGRAATAG